MSEFNLSCCLTIASAIDFDFSLDSIGSHRTSFNPSRNVIHLLNTNNQSDNIFTYFIENGRKDVRKRQEFSSWFYETGLVVVVELTSGRFEIGLGKRGEKGNLTELDMTLEHAAMFMQDGATFVDPEGNPLTIDDIKKTISQKEKENREKTAT